MFLSSSFILASLALLSIASSQVIVTVTNTITVVTVTVPPKTTSTSIIIVTVDADEPTTQSTSTKTVTVTAGLATSTAACPVPEWGQCGGQGFKVTCGCGSNLKCQYQNDWYSYCSAPQKVVVATSTRWRGWGRHTWAAAATAAT